MAPGVYTVTFTGPGTLKFHDLEIKQGSWTKIDVAWSGLRLTSASGEPFLVNSIQTNDDLAGETLRMVSNNTVPRVPTAVQQITMPPGSFIINVLRRGEGISKTVKLTEGTVTEVSF